MPATEPEISTFHPVLGTVLELRSTATDPAAIERAEARALETIDALEDVFTIHRPDSELMRWRRGELDVVSAALHDVLELTEAWFRRGRGTFNPAVGRLGARWRAAADDGVVPGDAELAAEAAAIAALPFTVRDGAVVRTGDCSAVELHAIAKGWIVDRACEAGAAVDGVTSFVVNLGGDLRHLGDGSLLVGIEDPHAPYDNAPPCTTVELARGGLATSGAARRGFRVGEQWFGHVLDPRTGRPVQHVGSVSVLAPDAATADVLATITGVLPVSDALAFVDALDEPVGLLVIGADGTMHRNDVWRAHERA